MPAATRLLFAFVLLICAFVVLVGVAVFSLYTVGQPMLAGVVAAAGLTGVAAAAVTYWFLQRDAVEEPLAYDLEPLVPEERPGVMAPLGAKPVLRRGPLRVQTMPVADLPSAYVDAVMRGTRARTNALKSQGPQHH